MLCSPTVNVTVDRLKPLFERAGVAPPSGPVSDAGRQEGEHEALELLLNSTEMRGARVTRFLVQWRGHADDRGEWLREDSEELSH
jgi:hypothetical protein